VGHNFGAYIPAVVEDVRIPCQGEQLAAYVYRPATIQGNAPCVVMGHGFTGTREDGLPEYAEAFRDARCVISSEHGEAARRAWSRPLARRARSLSLRRRSTSRTSRLS